jgi:hypothetical protein
VKFVFPGVIALVALFFLHTAVSAQGGWRQWRVHLIDGTELEANPLGMNEAGQFTRGMGAQTGIDRSKISYLAISRQELPALPKEEPKQDTVILLDGSQTVGPVKFRDFKFSEGVILQNGKEIKTENVAYIRFAQPKKKRSAKK